jgi:hypothetical protein
MEMLKEKHHEIIKIKATLLEIERKVQEKD